MRRNDTDYIPPNKRKKILLLSDDFRAPSGVGTVSKDIILGTCHRYNWRQVAALINHPENGKIINVDNEVRKWSGVNDADCTIYPFSGYGNQDLIRVLIEREKPDAIMHYTDPRFWLFLYHMEHEIRQHIPILFYHVWDDLPYPLYNESFYRSCDWIGCISKQTENLVKSVWKNDPPKDWQVDYIPHGIDSDVFYLIDEQNQKQIPSEGEVITDFQAMLKLKEKLFKEKDYDFVALYVNRNIRRKMPGDVILAFKTFCDKIGDDKAQNVALIMHTQPVDENGTNLRAVANAICPNYHVIFSSDRYDTHRMNCLYNISDVCLGISSAEGFGLGTAQAIMAGIPIIANVTGGLTDQMKFEDENGNWIEYTEDWGCNSDGRYTKCGDWAFPVFPTARGLVGSIPTPYIFDSRCDWEDVADQLMTVYKLDKSERTDRALNGRNWMMQESTGMEVKNMCDRFIHGIDTCLEKWTPRKKFDLFQANDESTRLAGGITSSHRRI